MSGAFTKEYRELLRKHAEHYQAMALFVQESGDQEIGELEKACLSATPTNCGWDEYLAAKHILGEIRSEQHRRYQARATKAHTAV